MAKRKACSASFKSKVALKVLPGNQTAAELASRYEIHRVSVTKWKRQATLWPPGSQANIFHFRGEVSSARRPRPGRC